MKNPIVYRVIFIGGIIVIIGVIILHKCNADPSIVSVRSGMNHPSGK